MHGSADEVNAKGFVFRHQLEDIAVTPPELQGAVDLALFAWPGGFSPPVAAMPYARTAHEFRAPDAWAVSGAGGPASHVVDASLPMTASALPATADHVRLAARTGTAGACGRVPEPRAPAPVAMAGETPAETPMETCVMYSVTSITLSADSTSRLHGMATAQQKPRGSRPCACAALSRRAAARFDELVDGGQGRGRRSPLDEAARAPRRSGEHGAARGRGWQQHCKLARTE